MRSLRILEWKSRRRATFCRCKQQWHESRLFCVLCLFAWPLWEQQASEHNSKKKFLGPRICWLGLPQCYGGLRVHHSFITSHALKGLLSGSLSVPNFTLPFIHYLNSAACTERAQQDLSPTHPAHGFCHGKVAGQLRDGYTESCVWYRSPHYTGSWDTEAPSPIFDSEAADPRIREGPCTERCWID